MLRDLVEQQQEGEGSVGCRFPRFELPCGGLLVIGKEEVTQPVVVFGGALEPDLAMVVAFRIVRRAKPEIDQRPRPLRHRAALHPVAHHAAST
jgi:hypothetical protein